MSEHYTLDKACIVIHEIVSASNLKVMTELTGSRIRFNKCDYHQFNNILSNKSAKCYHSKCMSRVFRWPASLSIRFQKSQLVK